MLPHNPPNPSEFRTMLKMTLMEEIELKLIQRKGLAAALLGAMAHSVAINTRYTDALRPVFEAVTKDIEELKDKLKEFKA